VIVSIAQAQLFFLALTRILAIIIQIPVLGGQMIPAQVRIAFGIGLTIILIPWQPLPADAVELGLLPFAFQITREVLIGTLAGFAASLTFGVITIAGETMDIGSGFGSSRIFNPSMEGSGSSYSQVFIMVAMLMFLLVNGHHAFLAALAHTFELSPLLGAAIPGSAENLVRLTAQLIAAGIQMALPVFFALLITDLTLGLLARVAPQVQVFFLGLPLKVGVSLIALSMLFTVIFPSLENLYTQLGPRMLQMIGR
jgi:flagellar biosynthetic protein FliR